MTSLVGKVAIDFTEASPRVRIVGLAVVASAVALWVVGVRLVRRFRGDDRFDARELLLAELEKDPRRDP